MSTKKKADLLKEIDGLFTEEASRYEIIRYLAETTIVDEPYHNVTDFIKTISQSLVGRITKAEMDRSEAHERIGYVKTYLDGEMYKTQEDAIKHLPIQRRNVNIAYEKTK